MYSIGTRRYYEISVELATKGLWKKDPAHLFEHLPPCKIWNEAHMNKKLLQAMGIVLCGITIWTLLMILLTLIFGG